MRLAEDKRTWEPWIIDPNGEAYEFFTATFKEFCDLDDDTASIVGSVYGRIRARAFDDLVERSHPSEEDKIARKKKKKRRGVGTDWR